MEGKLQTIANCMIIVTGLSVTSLVIQRWLYKPQSMQTRSAWVVGDRIDLGGAVDFRRSPRTLLLAADTHCQQCTRTMPFVRRMLSGATPGLRLVVATREPVDAMRQYLAEHQLESSDVAEISFDTLRVGGLPSFVVADGQGRVLGSWAGPVAGSSERQVLVSLGLSDVDLRAASQAVSPAVRSAEGAVR